MSKTNRTRAIELLAKLRSRFEEEQILDFLITEYFEENFAYEVLLDAQEELESNISCDIIGCDDDDDEDFDDEDFDDFDETEEFIAPTRETDDNEQQKGLSNDKKANHTFWSDRDF